MANPWHHAVSSAREWGGSPEDYLPVHEWFDEPKGWFCDQRQRAIRHHAEGIAEAVKLLKPVRFKVPVGLGESGWVDKIIPVRWVAEQHVTEDLGRVPNARDYLECMELKPWMYGRARKLSVEQEIDEYRR